MRVINLFGGPGSGKSTTAAGIFYRMKQMHVPIELVTEFAKDMVYDGQRDILRSGKHQGYIFARQHYRLQRLVGHVDWAVTDGPSLLTLAYLRSDDVEYEAISTMCKLAHHMYTSYNFFLQRPQNFQEYGRVHNLSESEALDYKIEGILNENGVHYHTVQTGLNAVDSIVDILRGKSDNFT